MGKYVAIFLVMILASCSEEDEKIERYINYIENPPREFKYSWKNAVYTPCTLRVYKDFVTINEDTLYKKNGVFFRKGYSWEPNKVEVDVVWDSLQLQVGSTKFLRNFKEKEIEKVNTFYIIKKGDKPSVLKGKGIPNNHIPKVPHVGDTIYYND